MRWMDGCLEEGGMSFFCDRLTCRIKARYYDADKFEAGDFR
jgi:hypothetical protein